MLGILGGMGPLATVDFMQKVIEKTMAGNDQEHLPMLVHNVPQIPDRSACILSEGEDPFLAMAAGVRKLEEGGAQCIVMPCNTAHYWFDQLQTIARVPMISIIDCVLMAIRQQGIQRVGIMATSATVAAGMYSKKLADDNRESLIPDEQGQQELMDAIYAIKAGRLEEGSSAMETVFNQLTKQGAQAVILGCTEIPVGLKRIAIEKPDQCIDATALLAQTCVDWYYGQQAVAA